MTDLLTLGSSGLRAYSRAMGTVGENIANAQSPGYARRTTRIEATLPASASVLTTRAEESSGYRHSATERLVDIWRVEDSRRAHGDAERATAALNAAETIENAMGQNGHHVGATLNRLFNSFDALSAEPESMTQRAQVVQRVEEVATSVRQTAQGLARAADQITGIGQAAIERLNTDLKSLHRVNLALLRASDGTANQASLMDERDRLLDDVSGLIAVDVDYGPKGQVKLQPEGQPGLTLVDARGPFALAAVQAFNGSLSFTLGNAGGSARDLIDPRSGHLAGLVSSSAMIADQRHALDDFAGRVVTDINTAHGAGRDLGGTIGAPLFEMSSPLALNFAAASITPHGIAAANDAGPSGNILAMGSLRGADGLEAAWTQISAGHSLQTNMIRSETVAAQAQSDAAFAARSEASAVDLDQEAADLLRFQQAYQASARVIQVARENLQSILNSL
jgi:flagellar hook-associated protein 1